MSLNIFKSGLSIIRIALILELIVQVLYLVFFVTFPLIHLIPVKPRQSLVIIEHEISLMYYLSILIFIVCGIIAIVCAVLYVVGWRRLRLFNRNRYGIGYIASILLIILIVLVIISELGYVATTVVQVSKYEIVKTSFSYFINSKINVTELTLITLVILLPSLVIGIAISCIVLFAIAFFRIGSDYKSTITEVGAILHAIPVISIVGTILLIIGLSKIMKQI